MKKRKFYLSELTWPDVKDFLSNHDAVVMHSCMQVYWGFRTKEISETGVIGDPTKASKEKGEKAWKLAVERLAELLTELDKMELEL